MNTATTSTDFNSLIAEGDPLTPPDWDEEKERQMRVRRELVKAQCVEQFSSSPFYQARAEHDPEFWDWFCNGVTTSFSQGA
ncbi:MAG TPA: hypothetical protein PLW81_00250 [Thiobacillaceae bacterium]|nr:hypothetical protein [Thiobacillaceae bacterium]